MFHMHALPLGWESQTCTGGASVLGMVWLVLSQWEPAIGTTDFFSLLWLFGVLMLEQLCVTKVHHSRISFAPGRIIELHSVPLPCSLCYTHLLEHFWN